MKGVCVLVLLLVGGGSCQNRPFYAPRPVNYPGLLSRFGDSEDLSNRVGGAGGGPLVMSGGSVVDTALLDRTASLPPDQQPFWYINRQAIQAHVDRSPAGGGSVLPPPQTSFFATG